MIITPRPFWPKGYGHRLRQSACPSIYLCIRRTLFIMGELGLHLQGHDIGLYCHNTRMIQATFTKSAPDMYRCRNRNLFRKGYSTTTFLIDFLDNISQVVDNSSVCGLLFLDLSKAFDAVQIDILHLKLRLLGLKVSAIN